MDGIENGGNEMSIEVKKEHGIVCRTEGTFGYYGWPSVARLGDGTIAAVASGPRLTHICPWGKDSIAFSHDEGETWSEPVVFQDSPLDDRDAGIVSLGGQNLLVSWFTLDPRQFWEDYRQQNGGDMRSWVDAKVSAIGDGAVKDNSGSWTRFSTDGGKTFSKPHRAPVTAPHGPVLLKSKVLMYVGKPFPENDLRPLSENVQATLSIDWGRTWKVISTLPNPRGFEALDVHEPHLAELPDGTLLVTLRVHEKGHKGIHEAAYISTWVTRSTDHGYTWSEPERLPCDGAPAHLLVHSSGTVVCVYGYRREPYGQRCLLSRDGVHWSEEIILRDDGPDHDLGYPASCELSDESILTVYYQKIHAGDPCSVLYTKWQLPENF